MKKGGEGFRYDEAAGAYRINIEDTADAKRIISAYDKFITDMEIVKGNMDDVFLTVTGRDIKLTGGEGSDAES